MRRFNSIEEINAAFEQFDLDDEYANFIMKNGDPSERIICNGDTLTAAMEDLYLLDEFFKDLLNQ